MDKVFLFGPLILTNNWSFRTNIPNISLDRNFPYIHDIVMGIRSVSPTTLILVAMTDSKHYTRSNTTREKKSFKVNQMQLLTQFNDQLNTRTRSYRLNDKRDV